MEEKKPKLSDWIQFLLSRKNRCAMWIIGDISALFVIFSIILLIVLNFDLFTELLKSILLLIIIFLLAISCYVFYLALSKLPELKKSTNLLEDIMKERIIRIEKIKEIWFKEDEKMYQINITQAIKHSATLIWLIILMIFVVIIGLYLINYGDRIIYSLFIQIFGVLLLSLWSLLEKYPSVMKAIANFVKKYTPLEGNVWREFDKFCRTTGLGFVMAGLIVELKIALD